jgi:arylsulfatase A-like enzyme
LTGQYPHNHGVLDNTPPRGGFPAFDDTNTLATYLDPAYATSLVGKYLNSMPDQMYIPPGWDDWRSPLNGSTYNYTFQYQNVNGVQTSFSGYMPETHGRQSRAFLSSVPLEQPFFSYVGWVAPHAGSPEEPHDLSSSPFVSKKYRGSYTGPRVPSGASFNEADVSDKPQFIKDLPVLGKKELLAVKQRLVQRRESLMAVDHQVGKIVADVAVRGQLDNTYFIFLSDNGQMQGEHRLPRRKGLAYEPSSRVPLIIRGPGFPSGLRYTNVTGLQDVVPTILDVTDQSLPVGAPQPDGVSLLGLIEGSVKTTRVQSLELAENAGLTDQQVEAGVRPSKREVSKLTDSRASWSLRGLVTNNRWKYVVYPAMREVEMYNLAIDPDELTNLHGRDRYARQQDRLAGLLQRYRSCAGLTCR